MKANQMSELADQICGQFRAAIGERMFENISHDNSGRTIKDIVFRGTLDSANINLYPCDRNGFCASEAVFLSLSSERNKKAFTALRKDQFISLDHVIIKMVQQVLGECAGRNKHVILITDYLNSEILAPWISVLDQLDNYGIRFEMVYLNSKGQMNLVDLAMYV